MGKKNSKIHKDLLAGAKNAPEPTLDEKIQWKGEEIAAISRDEKGYPKYSKEYIEAHKLIYQSLNNQKHDSIAYNSSVKVAQIEADSKKAIVKMQADPTEISQIEAEVFAIVKKYDFLSNASVFQNLLNSSSDKEVKSDAISLERDLKKLGMNLKVDGNIDQNTINAVEALISKNAAAVKAYKELTGIDLIHR